MFKFLAILVVLPVPMVCGIVAWVEELSWKSVFYSVLLVTVLECLGALGLFLWKF